MENTSPARSQGRRIILVGGGARSGKSAFALAYARRLAERRHFLATAQAFDEEMQVRIARHRSERGGDFHTSEEPVRVPEALAAAPADALVLVDCLTLWLSNLLLAELPAEAILSRVDGLIAAARGRAAPTLVVTNEVGMGIVPDSSLARTFRDLAGVAHQRLAAAADETYAAILGVVLRLHPAPLHTFRAGEVP